MSHRRTPDYDTLYAKGALAYLKGRSLAQAQSKHVALGSYYQRDAIADGYGDMRLDEIRRQARETFSKEKAA